MRSRNDKSDFPHPDKYNHREVETSWSAKWQEVELDKIDLNQAPKPYYNLMMFPYPSAEGLHVGNMYAFTGSDIFGRYKRLKGFSVFEPIGLDGFGIHSENFALKIGRHPMDHAQITEKNYYNQLNKIGAMYSWDNHLETYDPEYYRHTQWLFIQMFKRGLSYRKKAKVNWCPSCQTVLADEQVIDKKCERCGNTVEDKSLEQWFFKITAYAEKLLDNIPELQWSGIVKTAQKKWIGKKEGINITYKTFNQKDENVGEITCFTTRPDTNFGATFVVLAPEHVFVQRVLTILDSGKRREVKDYIEKSIKKTNEERISEGKTKTGVQLPFYCLNELNNQKLPVYISDFVLSQFGSGAVVGVPGHDKRDFEFARRFGIEVKRVVADDNDWGPIDTIEKVQEDEGSMVNSGFLDGLDIHKATIKMMDYLEKKGMGKRKVTYHLRDWLISRQRYWGPPIPMIYCAQCAKAGRSWFTSNEAIDQKSASLKLESEEHDSMSGWYPVPEKDLPVILPRIEDYKPANDGVAPLAKHAEFYKTTCPGCGQEAVRETDVSDTFLDSSWYFLRYPSVQINHGNPSEIEEHSVHSIMNNESRIKNQGKDIKQLHNSKLFNPDSSEFPWNPELTKKWLPVDMYTGGAEHSVLHLLYARFVTMALFDWGYLDFQEPFKKFFAHGLVIKDGAKMSKSKGNVVNPDEYIETFGADALRLYLMFMGPFSQGGDFRDTAMEGMYKWIGRIWKIARNSITSKPDSANADYDKILDKLIHKVDADIDNRRYNTAIAAMMEFTNSVNSNGGTLPVALLKKFLIVLSPLAPFITEELWQQTHARDVHSFRKEDSIHLQKWPDFDRNSLIDETIQIIVQVNGKLRDKVVISGTDAANEKIVTELALKSEKVRVFTADKTIKKTIFVPGRLINLVI